MSNVGSFELELDDFCDGCGYFQADVTKIDVSKLEDLFNKAPKFRTYIKCTKYEVCRHVASKMRESGNEKS